MAKRKTLTGQMRHVADCLDRMETPRFAAVIRAASKELSELRWQNGVLRAQSRQLRERLIRRPDGSRAA